MALEDQDAQVRRKAIYALSSEVRNYPPALKVMVHHLPEELRPGGVVNAADMDDVDKVMDGIKQASAKVAK